MEHWCTKDTQNAPEMRTQTTLTTKTTSWQALGTPSFQLTKFRFNISRITKADDNLHATCPQVREELNNGYFSKHESLTIASNPPLESHTRVLWSYTSLIGEGGMRVLSLTKTRLWLITLWRMQCKNSSGFKKNRGFVRWHWVDSWEEHALWYAQNRL